MLLIQCGRLEHGFLRVRCEACQHEHLVAFSCKRRRFCPSCGARRMAESAAVLVDDVFPREPIRQGVLSFPFPLRFLFASYPELMGRVLAIVYRTLATDIIHKAGAESGADRRVENEFEPGCQGSGFQLTCRGSSASASA